VPSGAPTSKWARERRRRPLPPNGPRRRSHKIANGSSRTGQPRSRGTKGGPFTVGPDPHGARRAHVNAEAKANGTRPALAFPARPSVGAHSSSRVSKFLPGGPPSDAGRTSRRFLSSQKRGHVLEIPPDRRLAGLLTYFLLCEVVRTNCFVQWRPRKLRHRRPTHPAVAQSQTNSLLQRARGAERVVRQVMSGCAGSMTSSRCAAICIRRSNAADASSPRASNSRTTNMHLGNFCYSSVTPVLSCNRSLSALTRS
jgi:hypothetical protein